MTANELIKELEKWGDKEVGLLTLVEDPYVIAFYEEVVSVGYIYYDENTNKVVLA